MPAYDAFSDDDLTLRDRLALDRTMLANERTLLAYLRTALALLAGSVALLQFAEAAWTVWLGWAALPLAVFVTVIGLARFWRVQKRLRRAQTQPETPPSARNQA